MRRAWVGFLGVLAVATVEQAGTYSLTDAGDLPNGTGYEFAASIKSRGFIVGQSTTTGGTRGILRRPGHVVPDTHSPLGVSGADSTILDASAIDDAGRTAARAENSAGMQHAVLLRPDLVPLPSAACSGIGQHARRRDAREVRT